MNIQHPDLIVRHIKTKNKIRKIVSLCPIVLMIVNSETSMN